GNGLATPKRPRAYPGCLMSRRRARSLFSKYSHH
ncbi:putative membrane protein, partial [Bordetella bronchiseptica MO211]